MADIPRHPDVDDAHPGHAESEPAARNWAFYVIAAVIVAVVLVVIVLHLTGVIQPPTHSRAGLR